MFYIIEQGARIQTPVDRLLQPRDVQEVSASQAIRSVASSDKDKDKDKDRARSSSKANPYGDAESEQHHSPVIFAHQLMSSPIVTAPVSLTVAEVWTLFSKQRFHHLPLLVTNLSLGLLVLMKMLLHP